jgi:hypothetical protein
MPVNSETAAVKARIRGSGARSSTLGVRPDDMNATSSPVAQRASSRPQKPPIVASSTFSTSSCPINRELPAPSASRIENSGVRAADRARTRLATLAHATRSTTPTTSISTNSGVENCWRRVESPRCRRRESESFWNALWPLTGRPWLGQERVQQIEPRQDSSGLLRRAIAPQASDDGQPETLVDGVTQPVFRDRHDRRLHHDGHEDIRRASDFEAEELTGCHADDRERHAGKRNRSPDDRSVESIPLVPVVVAEDRDGMTVRTLIVLRADSSARDCIDTQEREVIP